MTVGVKFHAGYDSTSSPNFGTLSAQASICLVSNRVAFVGAEKNFRRDLVLSHKSCLCA